LRLKLNLYLIFTMNIMLFLISTLFGHFAGGSIYDFKIKALDSADVIDFSSFRGKKILLVNVASRCGYTKQYEALQQLYEQYQTQMVVVGFPCNQFLFQESGSETKIALFCKKKYGVTFPMTTKIKVKGTSKHPIYKWLTSRELNGVNNYNVSWNFNKFLIDDKGKLIAHFTSSVKPYDERILHYLD